MKERVVIGSYFKNLRYRVAASAISSRRASRKSPNLLGCHNFWSSGMKCARLIAFDVACGKYCHGGKSSICTFVGLLRKVMFAMSLISLRYWLGFKE